MLPHNSTHFYQQLAKITFSSAAEITNSSCGCGANCWCTACATPGKRRRAASPAAAAARQDWKPSDDSILRTGAALAICTSEAKKRRLSRRRNAGCIRPVARSTLKTAAAKITHHATGNNKKVETGATASARTPEGVQLEVRGPRDPSPLGRSPFERRRCILPTAQ